MIKLFIFFIIFRMYVYDVYVPLKNLPFPLIVWQGCTQGMACCCYMAAPQNSRSGSTPKTHRRSRPPIQTCDPDRSRPHDPDLWSRPMIQTSCFILFGFVDPDPLFYFGVNMLDPAPSLPLWLDCGLEGHAVQLLAAASLLLAAAQLEHFGSRPVTKIWSKSAYPVPDLVPHRSRPVPDRSRSFPDRSMESNLMEEEFSGQCKIIWCFWGRIHTDYHDSIHSVPDVRNRRFTKVAVPDVRITAERSRPVYWCIAIWSHLDLVGEIQLDLGQKTPQSLRHAQPMPPHFHVF